MFFNKQKAFGIGNGRNAMTKDGAGDKKQIEQLVDQLSPCNQAYVLNTIDALLYSQRTETSENGAAAGDATKRL